MRIEIKPWEQLPAEVKAVLSATAEYCRTTVECLRADKTTRYGAGRNAAMYYLRERLGYKFHQIAAFCGRAYESTAYWGFVRGQSAFTHFGHERHAFTTKLLGVFDFAVKLARRQVENNPWRLHERRLDASDRGLAQALRRITILEQQVRAMEAALRRAHIPLPTRL